MTTYTTEFDTTLTISHRTGTYPGETEIYTIIEATDEAGQVISHLFADPATGEIAQVYTQPAQRRLGIATALVEYAVAEGIELYHAPAVHRTEDGDAFAESCDMIDEIDEDEAFYMDYESMAA